MNSFLYVGQYSEGTTSRMRADQLIQILKPNKIEIIDTHIPFFKTHRIIRSFGFRYKTGPLINAINTYILNNIENKTFDLIWVDKGVYIRSKVLKILKSRGAKIVHYTPDMAFYENKSFHFEATLKQYDFCVTTKIAEKDEYLKRIPNNRLIITTQGFSKKIHKPFYQFGDKKDAVVFIGLAEAHRFAIAEKLLQAGIHLIIVGKKWELFVDQNKHFVNLEYLGDAIYDEEYSKLISSSKFALGFLSKRFPEYHTTRTFEIPACGTALLTEKNQQLISFYNDEEVIYYEEVDDLILKIKYYLKHNHELEELITKGKKKVDSNGYDNETILGGLLKTILS